jgi:hypothetical protein
MGDRIKQMLRLVPISFEEANCFVEQYHRHRGAVAGAKFCIAVAQRFEIGGPQPGSAGYGMHADSIVGVAIVGRPIARSLDDGLTLEVNRCCTDGTSNACSMLYAAAWRAARALGYARLVTYTLKSETGASLRAAGFRVVGSGQGRSWSCPSRPRVDTQPHQAKLRWEPA